MAFRRGERGKCNEPVDDAGEHLVPHTHIGYAARDGRSWGSRLGGEAGHGGLTAASFVRGLMTMSRKTGMRGKAIAVICCLALLVGCTGCGALKEGSRRERQSQQGQSSQQGERIASSLKDYARSLLDSDGAKYPISRSPRWRRPLQAEKSAKPTTNAHGRITSSAS